MASSTAGSVEEYLAQLPSDRRDHLAAVREVVARSLPEGYGETMSWGMISYEVPLERYPGTYNGRLAAQKNRYALYLTCVYADAERERWLRDAWERAGKKLDVGKACVRFKKLDALPLEVVAEAIASTPVDAYVERYEASRANGREP